MDKVATQSLPLPHPRILFASPNDWCVFCTVKSYFQSLRASATSACRTESSPELAAWSLTLCDWRYGVLPRPPKVEAPTRRRKSVYGQSATENASIAAIGCTKMCLLVTIERRQRIIRNIRGKKKKKKRNNNNKDRTRTTTTNNRQHPTTNGKQQETGQQQPTTSNQQTT